jgi:hypothetical protein
MMEVEPSLPTAMVTQTLKTPWKISLAVLAVAVLGIAVAIAGIQ